ncbi:MAG: TlpA family protein disulfide reductase [Taibaiella sp.]|nr:TlpA family protein disulfide reductase [Taibaiella sp.]
MKKLITTLVIAASVVFSADAQVSLGMKAPDLAFPNPEGKTLKLSEINKDRYVLIDFWASWCRPCRMSNPGLVAMYKEYSNKKFKGAKKGFTVLNVSLDQQKDAWIGAIKQDGLIWPYHMSDLGGWNSKPAVIYGVQSIPQSILIGPDGKIVGMYQRAEESKGDLDKFVQ